MRSNKDEDKSWGGQSGRPTVGPVLMDHFDDSLRLMESKKSLSFFPSIWTHEKEKFDQNNERAAANEMGEKKQKITFGLKIITPECNKGTVESILEGNPIQGLVGECPV